MRWEVFFGVDRWVWVVSEMCGDGEVQQEVGL